MPRIKKYSGGIKCCVEDCKSRTRIKNEKTRMKFHQFQKKRFCELHYPKRTEETFGSSVGTREDLFENSPVHREENQQKSVSDAHVQVDLGELLNVKIESPESQLQVVLNSSHYLNFYTGFADEKQYKLFTNIMVEHSAKFKSHQNQKLSKHCKLKDEVQIFIVLTRLRIGLLEDDLAFRWKVCQATISNIFRYWINIMYSYLIQLPIWPKKEIVRKFMPQCFRDHYPSTRVILDGCEFFIQKPSDYIVQSSTYSKYKSHNTARGIVGIMPNGFISFISKLYPGRTSEKEVILKSGLLNKLQPGDSVMADRGFQISEELRAVDVDLNVPPTTDGISQFNFEDDQTTRDIASVRIHVERVIRDIRLHKLLNSTIPNNMADQLNEIWTVCCHLTNFTRIPLLQR